MRKRMMRAGLKLCFAVLALVLLAGTIYADGGVPAYPLPGGVKPSDVGSPVGPGSGADLVKKLMDDCKICLDLSNASETLLFPAETQLQEYEVKLVYRGRENGIEKRTPVEYAPVLVYANKTDVYRIYTDIDGIAVFNFSKYAQTPGECIDFVFVYCPSASGCGFVDCLIGMGMDLTEAKSYGWLENLPIGPPATGKPAESANPNMWTLKPVAATATYCVPPIENPFGVPGFCLPLTLIFALLGGALYLSGRNPLSGFDFSSPRVHKPYQYSARVRSMTFSVQSVMNAIGSIAGAATGGKGEEGGKGGGKEGAKAGADAGKMGQPTKGGQAQGRVPKARMLREQGERKQDG